jgi:putative transposase
VDERCWDIILENFQFYNDKYKVRLVAYVLMINHIHFVICFEEKSRLSDYLRDFKKCSSLQIRQYLAEKAPGILAGMAYKHRTQQFKVWEDLFDEVVLYTRKVCETKINYIHSNPVRAGLVTRPEDYKYSSASFYLTEATVNSQLLHDMEIIQGGVSFSKLTPPYTDTSGGGA